MPTTNSTNPRRCTLAVRFVVVALGVTLWFWTQSLIGQRALRSSGIGDGLHLLTAPLNLYLHQHPGAADGLLIVSSGLIDLLGVFLLASWIFGRRLAPFLGLVMLVALRQCMQALSALPAPEEMIWHYPGFPSLLVTYGVANDYFFSGHTAIAVFAARELSRFGSRWLTAVAVVVALFEIVTVLVLRAHYTMDVFTGVVTAMYVAYLSARISPALERGLARLAF